VGVKETGFFRDLRFDIAIAKVLCSLSVVEMSTLTLRPFDYAQGTRVEIRVGVKETGFFRDLRFEP